MESERHFKLRMRCNKLYRSTSCYVRLYPNIEEQNFVLQEYIPVGCEPLALYRTGVSLRDPPRDRDTCKTRMHSSRMRTARSSSHREDLHQAPPPGAAPPDQVTPPGPGTAPWTEFLTYACENITLPETSFAGGKHNLCKFAGGKNSRDVVLERFGPVMANFRWAR